MELNDAPSSKPQRPQHRRNASSKSNILRALVSPQARIGDKEQDSASSRQDGRTQTIPLLPPDHPHASRAKVLGERQGNMQSPPTSPAKSRPKRIAASKTTHDLTNAPPSSTTSGNASSGPKKSKSSTNLAGMFTRRNRSSKDLTAQASKDKENTTPPSSADGPVNTPIWAQFATDAKPPSRPSTRDSETSDRLRDEIERYTPKDYSPSKQRNFNGSIDQPQLRPTLASRPQSMYVMGSDFVGAVGRRLSGEKSHAPGRKSEDIDRRRSKEQTRRVSGEKMFDGRRSEAERKASGSSAEQAPAKEKINIAKRGGRVMAAVAALQGKSTDRQLKERQEVPLDPKAVDEAFEAVLESRNIPEPMRHKMRSLTLWVKADFVKQHQESTKPTDDRPDRSTTQDVEHGRTLTSAANTSPKATKTDEDDSKSTKRSRGRSRTFTFTKSDRSGEGSPSKKQRSSSKSRAVSTQDANTSPTTPSTPRGSMDKRRSAGPAAPIDFISYLHLNQDPTMVEVGRLHKLRILLRNETVVWVDSFVSLGGMTEIVGLLHRIMAMEWREEHEDQLLHETLLCLKGLCTTERAMGELEKVADELFPALMAMLFDDEKKGPAEYTTRAVVITVLFNFLAAASPETIEQRARRILAYLGEPIRPEEARPVDFVLGMRTSRPYKLWCRELTHVTKEVFWIFLHHLNVVPRPANRGELSLDDSDIDVDTEERKKALAATYTQRHFPGTRPPVPAAPYIGGVEWDATTYITAHLDLLNGLIASIPTASARNAFRTELQASGFEKVLGATLRTCKEKFYSGVHDGLRAWVAAAAEDGWDTRFVREGPTQEEQAKSCSPKKSSKKKDAAPKIEAPKLDLGILSNEKGCNDGDDDGWLG